jgi:hypothetical protein
MPGFRVGRASDDRPYPSVGFPGTGISLVQQFGKRR